MVMTFPARLRRILSAVTVVAATPFLAVAALVWRARADVLELVGAACLVWFLEGHMYRGGWLLAGVAAIVKATDLERRRRSGQ